MNTHDKGSQMPTKLKTVWQCGCDRIFDSYDLWREHHDNIFAAFGGSVYLSHTVTTKYVPLEDK